MFGRKDCRVCRGDKVSANIERPLPPYTGKYPRCEHCRGLGAEPRPLKWRHPLFAYTSLGWDKSAPVQYGCVLRVDGGVTWKVNGRGSVTGWEPNYIHSDRYRTMSRRADTLGQALRCINPNYDDQIKRALHEHRIS